MKADSKKNAVAAMRLSLQGQSLEEISKVIGLSRERCRNIQIQLAKELNTAKHPPEWRSTEGRRKHKAYWLKLLGGKDLWAR